jgi:hypothetical protein
MKTMKEHILATRVNDYINKSVRVLSEALGINISEYLRKLILHDLDAMKTFVDELKKTTEGKNYG